MKLKDALEHTRSQYASELSLISQFAKTTEQNLTRRLKRKPKVDLDDNDRKDLKKLVDFLGTSLEEKKRSGSRYGMMIS